MDCAATAHPHASGGLDVYDCASAVFTHPAQPHTRSNLHVHHQVRTVPTGLMGFCLFHSCKEVATLATADLAANGVAVSDTTGGTRRHFFAATKA